MKDIKEEEVKKASEAAHASANVVAQAAHASANVVAHASANVVAQAAHASANVVAQAAQAAQLKRPKAINQKKDKIK